MKNRSRLEREGGTGDICSGIFGVLLGLVFICSGGIIYGIIVILMGIIFIWRGFKKDEKQKKLRRGEKIRNY